MSAELAPELQEKLEELDRELEVGFGLLSILFFRRLAALHSSAPPDNARDWDKSGTPRQRQPPTPSQVGLSASMCSSCRSQSRIDVLSWFLLSRHGLDSGLQIMLLRLTSSASAIFRKATSHKRGTHCSSPIALHPPRACHTIPKPYFHLPDGLSLPRADRA